jgi:hypothetical protein
MLGMEIIMGLVAILAMLVWIGVGITVIATSIYYVVITRPMMKQYKAMIKEMESDF